MTLPDTHSPTSPSSLQHESTPPGKLTRKQLSQHIHSFLYKPNISDIPFTMTFKDINKRDQLRRNKIIYSLGGIVGINLVGFYFARKYAKYQKPLMLGSVLLSLGFYFLGEKVVKMEARKYLKSKFKMQNYLTDQERQKQKLARKQLGRGTQSQFQRSKQKD